MNNTPLNRYQLSLHPDIDRIQYRQLGEQIKGISCPRTRSKLMDIRIDMTVSAAYYINWKMYEAAMRQIDSILWPEGYL